MHDRPTAAELVDAVRQYLEAELLPTLTDQRLRFQTLIAANVLAIARRELQSEDQLLREECRLLDGEEGEPRPLAELRQTVAEANRRLCERIRGGDFDEPERFRELAGVLRRLVVRKLEIANPRYLAGFVRIR